MNTVDPTGSIIFTREYEENNSMPFLDAKFTRKEDGSVKSTVYRKKAHTDQYLNKLTESSKKKKNNKKTNDRNYRSQVVIPYIEGVSESTPSTEEIWSSNSHAFPHHPQVLVGTSQGQSRARRTGRTGVPNTMQELWCWVHWGDRKTTKNTTGGTQKGCRQHKKREIHKEREKKDRCLPSINLPLQTMRQLKTTS